MQVTEISYRETCNTGNYENIVLEMKASINESDDVDLCLEKLVRKTKRKIIEISNMEEE